MASSPRPFCVKIASGVHDHEILHGRSATPTATTARVSLPGQLYRSGTDWGWSDFSLGNHPARAWRERASRSAEGGIPSWETKILRQRSYAASASALRFVER